MKTEIEVKFLDISIDVVRARLTELDAQLEQQMRLMRRVAIHGEFTKVNDGNSFLRVRDEGDKVTMTYKQFDSLSLHGAKEIETTVGSFEDTAALLEKVGLSAHTYQETRRETWLIHGVEIMIDEWPWLAPYIEIEGQSEEAVRDVAAQLGFDWSDAKFGDVMVAYRHQYPHLLENQSISSLEEVKFDLPLPELLKK